MSDWLQVHVAHNVVIGRACLIAAQCGIAGPLTDTQGLLDSALAALALLGWGAAI